MCITVIRRSGANAIHLLKDISKNCKSIFGGPFLDDIVFRQISVQLSRATVALCGGGLSSRFVKSKRNRVTTVRSYSSDPVSPPPSSRTTQNVNIAQNHIINVFFCPPGLLRNSVVLIELEEKIRPSGRQKPRETVWPSSQTQRAGGDGAHDDDDDNNNKQYYITSVFLLSIMIIIHGHIKT